MTIILIIIFIISSLFLYQWKINNRNSPPIPIWPIFGMIPSLVLNAYRIHDFMADLMLKSGGTFMFKGPSFFSLNFLVTSDPINLNYILSRNFNNYEKGDAFREIFEVLGNGILATDSDLWRSQRRLIHSLLNNNGFETSLMKIVAKKVVEELVPILENVAGNGVEVDLKDLILRVTFDILSSMTMGIDPRTLSIGKTEVEYIIAMTELEEALVYRHVVPEKVWKLQRWLQIGEERKMRRGMEVVNRHVNLCILSKRERLQIMQVVNTNEGSSANANEGSNANANEGSNANESSSANSNEGSSANANVNASANTNTNARANANANASLNTNENASAKANESSNANESAKESANVNVNQSTNANANESANASAHAKESVNANERANENESTNENANASVESANESTSAIIKEEVEENILSKLLSIDGLSNKMLRDHVFNLIAAGHDTISASMTWCFWCVAKYPTVESNIAEEIRAIFPDSAKNIAEQILDRKKLDKMIYLHATILEVLRLYPPVPINHKTSIKPDTLPTGHVIKPSTRVLIPYYAMGRTKEIWGDDCLEFKPERWISSSSVQGVKSLIHVPSHVFATFNTGPRLCVGKETALIVIKMVAIMIIRDYNIRLVENCPVSISSSVVLKLKNEFKVTITKKHWGIV